MRVLMIEDDSATAQSIELMLKSESFNVYTTDLGEEGVDLGKLYDYDIILLDPDLAIEIVRHALEFGDHGLDLRDPAPFVFHLKSLQANESLMRPHHSYSPAPHAQMVNASK